MFRVHKGSPDQTRPQNDNPTRTSVGRRASGRIFSALAVVTVGACSPANDGASGPVVDGEAIGVEGAHAHGVVRIGLAVDGLEIALALDAPADAAFGFEHAPETDEERRQIVAALSRLRADIGTVLALPSELGCEPTGVEILEAPDVEDSADGHDHAEGEAATHSEVRLTASWGCATSPEGSAAALRLADLFDGVQLVDLTVITSRGQAAGRVSADAGFTF